MTNKEIKFFGTSTSAADQLTERNDAMKNEPPKFSRAQSFNMFSPRKSRYKRFGRGLSLNSIVDAGNSGSGGRGECLARDKNDNYNTFNTVSEKLSSIQQTNSGNRPPHASKLDMVDEVEGDEDGICGAVDGKLISISEESMDGRASRCERQHLLRASTTKGNRISRLRLHKFRKRSASCDGYDSEAIKRYLFSLHLRLICSLPSNRPARLAKQPTSCSTYEHTNESESIGCKVVANLALTVADENSK